MFVAPGLSAARADMDVYKEIAISRFKELKEVNLAIAAGVKQGFEVDGSTSATVVEANCMSQVCKPTLLVTQALRKTDSGGYSQITIVSALISPTTHFGTGTQFIDSSKMMKAVEFMKAQ